MSRAAGALLLLPAALAIIPEQPMTHPSGRPVVIAHRGLSALAPEHTLEAWDLALAAGADYLEQDLQMAADGTLVVLHDETLDRTARGEGCRGPARELSPEQLASCDVGSWFNEAHPDLARAEFARQRIPTFRQVLERYAGRARFYVETKNPDEAPGMERALLDLLDEFDLVGDGAAPPTVIIQSFSPDSLLLLRRLRPDLTLVQLLPDDYSAEQTAPLLPQIASYANGIGPAHGNVTAGLVRAAHDYGLWVHPYTVNEPSRMADLLSLGVDGLFTDRADLMRQVLAER